eukprot:2938286-Amphidinium_carterae.1
MLPVIWVRSRGFANSEVLPELLAMNSVCGLRPVLDTSTAIPKNSEMTEGDLAEGGNSAISDFAEVR